MLEPPWKFNSNKLKNGILKDFKKLIYTAQLKNNCPECFSTEGMTLEFRQLGYTNFWYRTYTPSVESHMECDKCGTVIYPISWDESIERVYDYHKKNAPLEAVKKRWKNSAKVALVAALVSFAIAFYFGFFYK